jgi:hypothetical protein
MLHHQQRFISIYPQTWQLFVIMSQSGARTVKLQHFSPDGICTFEFKKDTFLNSAESENVSKGELM